MYGSYQTWIELQSIIFTVLTMLAYVGGFAACLFHRRLAPGLALAAAGFAGKFAATGLMLLPILERNRTAIEPYLFVTISVVTQTVGSMLLVAGLWFALGRIRQQLALSLEPNHGRG